MPLTKLDIANRALDLTGSVPLSALDQDNDTARIIERNYDKILLRCLRKFPWPFAVKRVNLAPEATSPLNEFANQFILPADYLRTDEVFPRGFPYRIERDRLFSDESSVTLRYISSESLTETYRMDDGFVEYFAHELAAAICFSLTDSFTLRSALMKDAKDRFTEATAIDSQEFPEVEYDPGPWIRAFQFQDPESDTQWWT